MSVVGVQGARMLRPACAAWLVVAATETVIAVVERWPAQFGGKGDPAKIHTQWLSKGTALSPPAFLFVAMLVALALLVVARGQTLTRAGAGLAALVGAIGTVGALGELVAASSPAVPRGAQDAAIIGVLFSLAVAIAAVACLVSPAIAAPAVE